MNWNSNSRRSSHRRSSRPVSSVTSDPNNSSHRHRRMSPSHSTGSNSPAQGSPSNLARPSLSRRPLGAGEAHVSDAAASNNNIHRNNILLAGLSLSTIIQNSNYSNDDDNNNDHNPRPRRLWKIVDHNIPILRPSAWPFLNRYASCTIPDDASPSVVAVRIAECLRRRSVVAEYDEEAATASCWTADRCALTVHLWRTQDRNQQLLVECRHQAGPSRTFGWTTQAILRAAQSMDSGTDRRSVRQASALEYPRLLLLTAATTEARQVPQQRLASTQQQQQTSMLQALEDALDLVYKDRVGAQRLGLESLVNLTDVHCVGIDGALYTAEAVLGKSEQPQNKKPTTSVRQQKQRLQWMLYGLIVDRLIPVREQRSPSTKKEPDNDAADRSFGSSSCGLSLLRDSTSTTTANPADDDHAGALRSLALRVLTNALTVVVANHHHHQAAVARFSNNSDYDSWLLHAQWTSAPLIQALTDDLQGASRPPAVVLAHGNSRLASAHEAVLAIRCLGALGALSSTAQECILQNEETLSLLERARQVGRSTHERLEQEASRVYDFLTEAERSC